LLTIINDILDISKIEAGKLHLEYGSTNIKEELKDLSQIFYQQIDAKSLEFTLEIEKTLEKTLMLDIVRIRQILFNLIGNAIKFTDKGFIKVKIKSFENELNNTVDLIISVEDSGIGIPKEFQENIFKSFEQQEGQSNRKFGGTGLGLAISTKLAGMMNGEIILESELDKGSTFTLHLNNIKKGSTEVLHNDKSTVQVIFDKATVLVVDDVKENRTLVIEYFKNSNLEFIEAKNGEEAISLTKEKKPSLIVMDIRMPKINGFEATATINELLKDLAPPIIALTASINTTKESMQSQGFAGFLSKPVSNKDLVEEFSKYLSHTKINKKPKLQVHNQKNTPVFDFSEEVLKTLEMKVSKQYEISCSGGAFEDITEFSNILKDISKEYDLDDLAEYSKDIDNAIEVFDIEKIDKLMKQYEDIHHKYAGNKK
jgi:CheY-like chemotaxis protein